MTQRNISSSMSLKRKHISWSNEEYKKIIGFSQHLKEIEKQNIQQSIINKDNNHFEFYRIIPKEDLPKCYRSANFQTIHLTKANTHCSDQIPNPIKISHKNTYNYQQKALRKQLKKEGYVKLLSQVYHQLEDGIRQTSQVPQNLLPLEQWQLKQKKQQRKKRTQFNKVYGKSICIQKQKLVARSRYTITKFQDHSDFCEEVVKNLDIIKVTQSHQTNKYALIENSSKLLKKDLNQKQKKTKKIIGEKYELLENFRKEHHQLYLEKMEIEAQQRQLIKEIMKSESQFKPGKSYAYIPKVDRVQELVDDRKILHQTNKLKIQSIKQRIQNIQEQIKELESKYQNIIAAQIKYYTYSLKLGQDCRQNGLSWILKEIKQHINNINSLQFPSYLSKQSKTFLISKNQMDENLQQLLTQKQQFIKDIRSSEQSSSLSLQSRQYEHLKKKDEVKLFGIDSKYRKSKRHVSILNKQYLRNQNLIEYIDKKSFEISSGIQQLNGKQIYSKIQSKLKTLNLNKLKRQEKHETKNLKIIQYQNLLQKIKNSHIELEELQLQHQKFLVLNFNEQRQLFFQHCAACFGFKRAHQIAVKNFSVKKAFGEQ